MPHQPIKSQLSDMPSQALYYLNPPNSSNSHTHAKFNRCHQSQFSQAVTDLNPFVGALISRNPNPNRKSMATEEPAPATELAPVIEAAVTVVVEKEPSAEAAEGKPKKARKTPAKGKPRSPSLHPPYFEMIKDAISTLKEKSGSSQYAIAKFVEEKQKNLPASFKKVLLVQLKRLVAEGKLVKVKASYKLPASKAPTKKKPAAKSKPKPKPKVSVKPKPAAKKAPAKKKPAAKPKPAPKAKAVAKPKPAAKPKSVAKAKPAAKAKAKAPSKPAKVARTSTRSTPGGKAAAAANSAKVARTSKRSTPAKKTAAVAKLAAKSVKTKAPAPKKAAAKRKTKK